MACSAESTEGFCPQVDTTCSSNNVCLTCDTFGGMGGACTEIDYFPNATVAEYGMIELDDNVVTNIMTEIYVRGYVVVAVAPNCFVCVDQRFTHCSRNLLLI